MGETSLLFCFGGCRPAAAPVCCIEELNPFMYNLTGQHFYILQFLSCGVFSPLRESGRQIKVCAHTIEKGQEIPAFTEGKYYGKYVGLSGLAWGCSLFGRPF